MTRKYPLDPLRRVRAENVDRKVRALSDSLRQVEAAREVAERAERRQRELEDALRATTSQEWQRLTRGELTAADLARGAAWAFGAEIDRAERIRAVEQARIQRATVELQVTERQLDVADAKASVELVAKHYEGWQRARTAEDHARDEEDAEQAHLNLRQRGAR